MIIILAIVMAFACAAVPVLGEDAACIESESRGESVCASLSHEVIHRDDDDSTSGGDDAIVTEHSIWWNYSIDQLFENHFNCAEILYGYNSDHDSEEDSICDCDDICDDVIDDNNDHNIQENHNKGNFGHDNDIISDVQLQKLRQQWSDMREKYIEEVNLVPIIRGESAVAGSNQGEAEDELSVRRSSHSLSSIVVPIKIGDAGREKGRGVFATKQIRKGTLISDTNNGNTGIFKVGHSWREFAVSLPKETACNFIEWSWVQTVPPLDEMDDDIRSGVTIFIAFDESSLMNSGEWDAMEANVRCGSQPMQDGDDWGPCRFHYYAARDIDAGEELLLNYGDFEDTSQRGWSEIGL